MFEESFSRNLDGFTWEIFKVVLARDPVSTELLVDALRYAKRVARFDGEVSIDLSPTVPNININSGRRGTMPVSLKVTQAFTPGVYRFRSKEIEDLIQTVTLANI